MVLVFEKGFLGTIIQSHILDTSQVPSPSGGGIGAFASEKCCKDMALLG
jgi:hypothetical protein